MVSENLQPCISKWELVSIPSQVRSSAIEGITDWKIEKVHLSKLRWHNVHITSSNSVQRLT